MPASDNIATTDELLKSVSRTFYLTLKVLPKPLRGPISLAYLLARSTDTIADTAEVEASVRLKLLSSLSQLIKGVGDNDELGSYRSAIASDFTAKQSNAAEANLLNRVELLLEWLEQMNPFQLDAIRNLLSEIIDGQSKDIMRFPADGTIEALPDAESLHNYTYQVAGCVGEFWTRLCSEKYGTRYSKMPMTELLDSGIRFGKGLQLVNIIRDLPEDLANGRCYLPQDELKGLGVTFPINIPNGEEETTKLLTELLTTIRPVAMGWLDTCSQHLDDALTYVMRVRHRRLRFAGALPLNLAGRTTAMLRSATISTWLARIKISRTEVKKITKKSALALLSPRPLKALYGRLSDPSF